MKIFPIDLNKASNLLLILFCVWYLKNCGSVTEVEIIPDDYISIQEFNYRVQVIELLKTNQNLEHEIQTFKDKYEADTNSINNATFSGTRDMFTDHFKNR